MSKIYTEEGFVNWEYLYSQTKAFCMATGARATGKTYGLLKLLIEHKIKFLYLRRLRTQLDQCASVTANPFKKLNTDLGLNIQPYKSKELVRFIPSQEIEGGRNVPDGEPVAIGLALSTFATMRGMDFSDIDAVVFDEAIPMVGEKAIKDEFNAFLHFYETVNRNRELEGRQPVRCFLLGNANKLANPYFAGWGFMRTALNMIRGEQMMWRSADGTRLMVLLLNSPISKQKASTVLYQNGNDDFIATALDNAFRVDPTTIKSYPLRELIPICGVGEVGIYRHKSSGLLYVSHVVNRNVYYPAYGIHLTRFKRDFVQFRILYLSERIVFENYDIELIFRELLDI